MLLFSRRISALSSTSYRFRSSCGVSLTIRGRALVVIFGTLALRWTLAHHKMLIESVLWNWLTAFMAELCLLFLALSATLQPVMGRSGRGHAILSAFYAFFALSEPVVTAALVAAKY